MIGPLIALGFDFNAAGPGALLALAIIAVILLIANLRSGK